jgi:tight adherence protein C
MTTGLIGAIIAAAAFTAVLGVLWALRGFLNPERTAADRVADLTTVQKVEDNLTVQTGDRKDLVGKVSALSRPTAETELVAQRRWMAQAGFRGRGALETFSVLRSALTLGLLVVGLLVAWGNKPIYIALGALVGAAIGYYAPKLYVDSRRSARQETLMKPFPDAMDLLVSSVEAGLGLDAAFRRVAKEMDSSAPALAAELQMVNYEVEAGVARVDALRHFDHRTGLEEVNALVNVLLQAERFGTSVASALRNHSDLVRKKRMLAAEEKAAGISPKLTVAMIVFVLPALFTVLVGPAAVNIKNNVLPAMGKE